MAIPASVGLYVNWIHGSDTGTNYVTNTPEIPDAATWAINTSTIASEAGSPWNGQYLLDVSASGNDGAQIVGLTSSEIAATSGRILIELTAPSSSSNGFYWFAANATNDQNFRLRARRASGSPDFLQVTFRWNATASDATINFASFPTNPFAIEIIYDANNSTANQRLRARYWDIGTSPGSFTDATSTTGSAATTDQPVNFTIGDYNNNTIDAKFGRIIVSNDITEDLSAVSESSTSVYAFQ